MLALKKKKEKKKSTTTKEMKKEAEKLCTAGNILSVSGLLRLSLVKAGC